MAINTALLISAPILQNYLVDKDTGAPLSAGVITMFQDNSRTFLKNWYYQTGVPGNYTYIALPNPMTLTSVGTMEDSNGNDIIPFYYPYSEDDENISQPYYVTVDNSNGERQFTRANFPLSAQSSSLGNSSLDNLIINNRFWRNIGSLNAQNLSNSITINDATIYYAVLAPSQHDTFSMPDIQYQKNINGASETITFETFPLGQAALTNDILPEYYINHLCTSTQSGETYKVYQFPISLHIKTLSNATATISLQANYVSGSNQIQLGIYQFLGTGVTSSSAIVEETITISTGWNKYTKEFTFPSDASVSLSEAGDDAYYLQIGMPAAAIFEINFALPSLYLSSSSNIPINNFSTYDQIDSIINSPRTGDIRVSLNNFYYYGWAPMNDATLCNAGSITSPFSAGVFAYQGIEAWPLFNLIWTLFKPYDAGGINPIAQMYGPSGSTTSYGSSSYADWIALKQIQLTKMMGRAMLGTVPSHTIYIPTFATVISASNSAGNLLFTAGVTLTVFNGMPVYFILNSGALPTGISINTIYYISGFNGSSSFLVSTTYANALAGTVIAYTNAGSGSFSFASALTGSTSGEYAHTQLINEMISHTHDTLNSGYSFVTQNNTTGTTVSTQFNNKTISNDTTTGAPTGYSGQSSFNIVQPAVFMNMYIKL